MTDPWLYVAAVFAVAFLFSEWRRWIEAIVATRERADLLNRIQAGTLADYATHPTGAQHIMFPADTEFEPATPEAEAPAWNPEEYTAPASMRAAFDQLVKL